MTTEEEAPSASSSLEELRQWCAAGLADLPIPTPFSIDQLRLNIEKARNRTIIMKPIPDAMITIDTACGLRIKDATFSVILYRERPSRYLTEHVMLHELVHEWFDHGTQLDADRLRSLLPSLGTDLIERVAAGDVTVQARANYGTVEEKVAEIAASLIPRMAREVPSDDMLGRLDDTLSRPAGGSSRPGRRLRNFLRRPFVTRKDNRTCST
ncbi:toxin [Streptomyces chrestomyceticus]|uniref:toxin n=1 Tax=Streptomyces chrestomyceticus TaxID=68185 RepID=UPI0033C28C84